LIETLAEMGPDPDYRSRFRRDSAFFVPTRSGPGVNNLGKTGAGVKRNF